MKPYQQDKAQPKEIHVNYVFHHFNLWDELYYFEKLNVIIISDLAQKFLVRRLVPGKANQLQSIEDNETMLIQKNIQKQVQLLSEPKIIVLEEKEQIIVHGSEEQKLLIFQYGANEFKMTDLDFNYVVFQGFEVFEKYYIGYDYKKLYVVRKNNQKLVFSLFGKNLHPFRTSLFHLMIINRESKILLYKRSSFNGKIIRNFKYQAYIIDFNGRFFSIKNIQQKILRIIDSTNMKIEECYHSIHLGDSHPITQLGIFLISTVTFDPKDQTILKIDEDSSGQLTLKLDGDSLGQLIKSENCIYFIKYSQNLGLIVFQNKFEKN